MSDNHEQQAEQPQNSPSTQSEASTFGGNAQIINLMRLVEELTQKHNSQQTQMESFNAEN
ncbi:hypothetical protein TIFTF001_025619 [Ficus carica]|uniref:Uncharacterized protein n=1 Tax=Ficus carica TaxID=3494 RepID=A0AA88DEC5_FICCA|nr:hypothetical protein TIFTF001_025619 [Ficus carica]